MSEVIESKSISKSNKNSNTPCPSCRFTGDERFPKGFTKEGDGSLHCPSCGYREFPKQEAS